MTQQQVINYIKHRMDIQPIIQTNVKLLTPAVQHAALENKVKNIWQLAYVPNIQLTDEIKWHILKDRERGTALKDLTPQMYMYIAQTDPFGLGYYQGEPPDEAKWVAIKKEPSAVRLLRPTKQMVDYALNLHPDLIGNIDNPTYQQIIKRKRLMGNNADSRPIIKAVGNMNISGDEARKVYRMLQNDISDYEEERLQQLRGLK